MNNQEYVLLFEKFLNGSCTAEELESLKLYDPNFDFDRFNHKITKGNHYETEKKILYKLTKSIKNNRGKRVSYALWYKPIAALLICALTIGILIYKFHFGSVFIAAPSKVIKQNSDILPGGNNATLTLSNGKKLVLKNLSNGLISIQGNHSILKNNNNEIVYTSTKSTFNKSEILYNTITTPRGGEYQVVLPDGSKVWLNAESSLKFPVSFTGNYREVELKGEGYFEISKNKKRPFKVFVGAMTVQVLGTHFNVMAYPDEQAIKTTLFEGSVSLRKNNKDVLLLPGQQGVALNNSDEFRVSIIDTEEELAWKNEQFVFHNESIGSIMRRVSRWYDIDFEFHDNVENRIVGGSVSRFKNISELMHIIELTGALHYKIEGRKIIMMK